MPYYVFSKLLLVINYSTDKKGFILKYTTYRNNSKNNNRAVSKRS